MIDLSVVIPVYNTPAYQLLESVNSMLKQTTKNPFDIVIMNDGSTNEDTIEAIGILSFYNKGRIKFYDAPVNVGTAANLNQAHELIKSEYIALMSSNDVSHVRRLEIQIARLEKDKTIDVLGTNLFIFRDIDITRKVVYTTKHKEYPTPENTPNNWFTNHGTVIYKNESVKKVGMYKPALRRHQDKDLFERMMAAKMKIVNLPDVLYGWRR